MAISDPLRPLLEEGQVDDPRFRDPSRFPCGVVGCEEPAHGWVLREALALHGLGELEVRSDLGLVYLCFIHWRGEIGRGLSDHTT